MAFLPIVVRELTVAARSPLTRSLRTYAVLIAGGIAGGLMLLSSGSSLFATRELPGAIFGLISSLLFGWCFLAGVVLTSDCLSSEKRQGTLGLLFLTDLRGYDVVLGKAAAASAQALSVVIVVLPVLALPLLMGSVTWGQFVRMAVALVVTVLWSLALGTLISARHRDGRRAVLTTLGTVLTVLLLPMAIVWVTWEAFGVSLNHSVGILSPLSLVLSSYETTWTTSLGAKIYALSLAVVGGTATVSLAAASWLLPRAWMDWGPAQPAGETRSQSSGPVPPKHVRFRSSPYEAIVASSLRVPWPVRWVFGLAALVWLGCVLQIFSDSFGPGRRVFQHAAFTILGISAGLHVLLKLVTAVMATERASEDTANGALELLLTTPLQPAALRRGHLDATTRLLWRTKVILSAANVVSFIAVMVGLRASAEDAIPFGIGFFAGIATLWLDTRLIVELGLICGVRRRRHARAAFEVAARVLVPGWIGFLGTILVMAAAGGGGIGTVSLLFALCAMWCLGASWVQLGACGYLGNRVFLELTGGGWAFGRSPRGISPTEVRFGRADVVS